MTLFLKSGCMFGKALVKEIALCSMHLTVSLLFIPINGQSDIINDKQENYLIINANYLLFANIIIWRQDS